MPRSMQVARRSASDLASSKRSSSISVSAKPETERPGEPRATAARDPARSPAWRVQMLRAQARVPRNLLEEPLRQLTIAPVPREARGQGSSRS